MTDISLDETNNTTPGRICPLHYRYSPSVFNHMPSPDLSELDVLYVVGGLYGNVLALEAIESAFAAEAGNKRMVFNGDFHWFDAKPELFEQIELGVSKHLALRGNVETELISGHDDAGCGCAYPDWVDDGVVERSNLILQTLRGCVTTAIKSRFSTLPMWELASVGSQRVGIVHGDAKSLAGWGFSQERLQDASHRQKVATWFEAAKVDVFACTHTCLPVMQQIANPMRKHWVINNGSAGMPNFKHDATGLVTRIAVSPYLGQQSRAHNYTNGLNLDLLAIELDQAEWQAIFMSMWPTGSHAHTSYWNRISHGPNYLPNQVIRY